MTPLHPAIEVVKKTLQELLPAHKPEEREKLLRDVLENIDDHAEDKPTLTINMKELKLHIEKFVDHHLFEKEFEKTIKQYTKDLKLDEQKHLNNKVKEDMEKLQKKGMDFKKNPKALEIMMKLLVLKHCLNPDPKFNLKHRLKVDPAKETRENLDKLKIEYLKLLKELEKTDPKLVHELTKLMKEIFREMDKKIESREEQKNEISLLFRLIITLSDPPKDKEFEKLAADEKVKIITQGSLDGKYPSIPRTDINMPEGIIIFPNTPADVEKKDHIMKSPFDISKGPTPDGHKSSGKN